MFYQCTLPVQTIELKSVGVRLACRRAFVPAPDVWCSSRHLAERDPLNSLARVAPARVDDGRNERPRCRERRAPWWSCRVAICGHSSVTGAHW